EAGAGEAVKLQALDLSVTGANGSSGIALVALYPDADDDGKPDSETPLASGTFAPGGEALALLVDENSTAATVPAGDSSAFVIVVGLGPISARLPSAPAAVLASLFIAPFALALRRRRARLVLLALCACTLVSCRTALPDPQLTYRLVIESATAAGSLSGALAEVSGLPLAGTVIGVSEATGCTSRPVDGNVPAGRARPS